VKHLSILGPTLTVGLAFILLNSRDAAAQSGCDDLCRVARQQAAEVRALDRASAERARADAQRQTGQEARRGLPERDASSPVDPLAPNRSPTPPKPESPPPPTEEQLRLDAEARAQSDREYNRHLQAQQGVSSALFRQRIDQILAVRRPEYPLDDVGQTDAVNRITWSEVALYYALVLDDSELIARLRQFVYDDRRTALRDKDARKMVPTRSVADIESSLKTFYSVSDNDPDRFQGEVYRWVSEEVGHVASERAYGGRKSKYR
jgi:hypothetical protein